MSLLRAAAYARVSSQAQRERHTIGSQLAELPRYAAAQGWDVTATYVDDGHTAKAGHLAARGGFQRLLADVAAKRFDVVVVVDLDRITRSEDLTERGAVLGAFQRVGVKIAVTSTGQLIDLNSTAGDLFGTLAAFFAAEENRKRRERTIRGKIAAAARGRKPAGPTPYGYLYERSTGAWSANPDTAPWVERIFQRMLDGLSCLAIARELNALGAPRARGGAWSTPRVRDILLSESYVGRCVVDKRRKLVVAVPPLVTEDIRDRALAEMGSRRKLRRSQFPGLCQGLSICGICGAPMRINGGGARTGTDHRTYVCSARLLRHACTLRYRQLPRTDDAVWHEVRRVLEDPVLLAEAVAARSSTRPGKEEVDAEVADLESRLARLERREATILGYFRRGQVGERAMAAELGAAGRERALLDGTLAVARRRASTARQDRADDRSLVDAAAAWRGCLSALGTPERREFIRAIVPGRDGLYVVFHADRIELLARDPRVLSQTTAGYISGPPQDGQFRLLVAA